MPDEDTTPSPCLAPALRLAYPMWAARHATRPRDFWLGRASECAVIIASGGDVLLFGGKKKQTRALCAETFNALAEALGLMCLITGNDDGVQQFLAQLPDILTD